MEESGMFYGEYQHSLDRKGRLIFPSRFREIAKENYIERFYITRGLDKCLFVFTEEEWKLQEQRFKSLPFTKAEARKFNRLYFSGACEIIPDKQGRVLIPKYLKEYAGVEREVVIVGVANRIEVWSQKHLQEFYEKTQGSFEDIAEKLIE
jgi:MraZ protein